MTLCGYFLWIVILVYFLMVYLALQKLCILYFFFVQKKDGCNKMTCTKCHAYFCWLCLTVITTLSDPYTHFSSVGSPCFNRLFEGVIDEDNDDDMEFVDVM
jgi:hypothetical protein